MGNAKLSKTILTHMKFAIQTKLYTLYNVKYQYINHSEVISVHYIRTQNTTYFSHSNLSKSVGTYY